MDLDTVTAAAASASADGAFQLDAHGWTGTLVLVSGEQGWAVPVDAGAAGAPRPATSVTVDGADDVVVVASPETWRLLLTSPPPPGFVNLVGATATGLVTVTPMPASSDRHLRSPSSIRGLREACAL